MTTVSADRIPLTALKDIITRAMQPGDYAHDTAWINGGPVEVDTPEQHIMTAGILFAALPEPGPGGTVDQQEAATSILRVISGRLTGAYIIRAHSLVSRLTEISEEYEQAHGVPVHAEPAPGILSGMPRCGYCGQPCKHKLARYCTPSHRQQAYKKRKRG